ncbi:MAG: hypothetical protein LUE63_07980 [Lachnospiraceae bacterium]|nr:hypothetical protein [Lachnospiraceae bacterium]
MSENKEKKTLVDLWPRDYGLRGEEAVIGQMLLAYLSSVGAEQAERIMSEVVKPNDSVELKHRVEVSRSSIVIDCKQLAPVIDRSAEMAHSYLVEGFLSRDMESDVHSEFEKVGGYIEKISGTTASQNRSPKFFDFLYDCYLVTRR